MQSCCRYRRHRSATALSCLYLMAILHGAQSIITNPHAIKPATLTTMRRGHADDAPVDYHSFNVSASYGIGSAGGASGDVRSSSTRTAAPSLSVITDSDLQCLSELPVEKLLRIRKTLRYVSHMLDTGVEPPLTQAVVEQHQLDQQHSYATTEPPPPPPPTPPPTPLPSLQPLTAEEIIGPRRRSDGTNGGRYVGTDGYAFEGVHRTDGGAQSAALIMDHIK